MSDYHSTNDLFFGLVFTALGLYGVFNWNYLRPSRYKWMTVIFFLGGIEGLLLYYGVLPIWK